MVTIYTPNGPIEMADSDPRVRAHDALRTAAERMGRGSRGRGVTPEHRAVIDAMSNVLSGRVSPESAMALLHEYDVLKQRLVAK